MGPIRWLKTSLTSTWTIFSRRMDGAIAALRTEFRLAAHRPRLGLDAGSR